MPHSAPVPAAVPAPVPTPVSGGPLHFAVAGPIGQRTGGYIYDRRIVEELRGQGMAVALHELPGGHPLPDAAARAAAAAMLDRLPDGALLVVDGLALPALAPDLPRHAGRIRLVALIHHPLALETGLAEAERAALDRAERAALAQARRVLAPSRTTAADLRAMGVAERRIGIVPPGCDHAGDARRQGSDRMREGRTGPARLLCVATLTPRKGHALLIEALAGLRDLDWRLDCVGSLDRDPATAAAVRAAVDRHGLAGRVALHGERAPAALAPFYRAADLFVLASFHEGYGMVLAEALSCGLPVVATTAGAIPEVVPPAAGLLVPPGDAAALRAALRRLLTEPDKRAAMAEAAARLRFPTWAEAAARFAAELGRTQGQPGD